jgi:WD40 repeat protein
MGMFTAMARAADSITVKMLDKPGSIQGIAWPGVDVGKPQPTFSDTAERTITVHLPNGKNLAMTSMDTSFEHWEGQISHLILRPAGSSPMPVDQAISHVEAALKALSGSFGKRDAGEWQRFKEAVPDKRRHFRGFAPVDDWLELEIGLYKRQDMVKLEITIKLDTTGKEPADLPGNPRELARVTGSVAFTFSPDSRRLFVGNQAYDTQTGKPTGKIDMPPRTLAHSLVFSPDGKQIACIAGRRRVLLVDAATLKVNAELRQEKLNARAVHRVIGYSPDGKVLYTIAGTVVAWSLANPEAAIAEVFETANEPGKLLACALSPDGKLIAGAFENRSYVRLWDTQTGKLTNQLKPRHREDDGSPSPVEPEHLEFTADGRRLHATGYPGELKTYWEMATRQAGGWVALERQGQAMGALSPDGRLMAFATWNTNSANGLYVVDAITGQVKALARPLNNLWSRTAWSPDGRWIAAMDFYGRVLIFDAKALMR